MKINLKADDSIKPGGRGAGRGGHIHRPEKDRGRDEDKTRTAFLTLKQVYNKNQICIFSSNGLAVLLYVAETWRNTK